MNMRTKTRRWTIVGAGVIEHDQWLFEDGVKNPTGRMIHGYVTIDVRDQSDWDELLPQIGQPVTIELEDGPRLARLTDQRGRDVEEIGGRPTTVAVTYGWEAYPDPVQKLA